MKKTLLREVRAGTLGGKAERRQKDVSHRLFLSRGKREKQTWEKHLPSPLD